MPPWITSCAWLGFRGREGTGTGEEHLLPGRPQDQVSQFSSPCSRASALAVSLARPDIDLLQGAPEEQGGEPGNKEVWVPMSTLPPGPQDPG